MKLPVHVEVEIKLSSTKSCEEISELTGVFLSGICSVFVNGAITHSKCPEAEIWLDVNKITICELEDKIVSFW